MLRLFWQGQNLNVNRLIYRRGLGSQFDDAISAIASRLQIALGDDDSEPRPGDFWIGCHPRTGWGEADPLQIGWASIIETPLVIGLLGSIEPSPGDAPFEVQQPTPVPIESVAIPNPLW
jgi:hypothetical protein